MAMSVVPLDWDKLLGLEVIGNIVGLLFCIFLACPKSPESLPPDCGHGRF